MITAKDNTRIKQLRKLRERRFRLRLGLFAAEGEDLVDAALAAGWEPVELFCTDEAPQGLLDHPRCSLVEHDVLASAGALGSGARAVAVFAQAPVPEISCGALTLYAEGVADPGNVGTLLRSAAAFADTPVLLGPGCADPWSPKALRAAMGATFAHQPATDAELPQGNVTLVGLDAAATTDIRDLAVDDAVVICVGAERDGLSDATSARLDQTVRITMRDDGPESLNVAMAATVALHQLAGIRD